MLKSAMKAFRMYSSNGSPSGVLVGPTARQVISLRPGFAAVNGPTLTACPLNARRTAMLLGAIE
jgi:hypothetical protein